MNYFDEVLIVRCSGLGNSFEKDRQLENNLEACLDDCNFKFKRGKEIVNREEFNTFVVLPKNIEEVNAIKEFAFSSFGSTFIYVQDNQGVLSKFSSEGEETRLGKLRMDNSPVNDTSHYFKLNENVYLIK